MNAIKFIKNSGVDKAREELNKLPNSNVTHMTDDARMFIEENNPLLDEFQRSQIKDLICIEDLKRLVESVDLINCFDDLNQAKSWIPDLDYDWTYIASGNRFTRHELQQAISDYELICEVK